MESLAFADPQKYASIHEVLEVESMPVRTQSSGLWDISVWVKGEGKLTRVASLNHPVIVSTTQDHSYAHVNLKPEVDRSLVPNRDFVLYIRDEGISTVSAISAPTPSNQQAVSIKLVPDYRM